MILSLPPSLLERADRATLMVSWYLTLPQSSSCRIRQRAREKRRTLPPSFSSYPSHLVLLFSVPRYLSRCCISPVWRRLGTSQSSYRRLGQPIFCKTSLQVKYNIIMLEYPLKHSNRSEKVISHVPESSVLVKYCYQVYFPYTF